MKSLPCFLLLMLLVLFVKAQYYPSDNMRFTTWNPGLNGVGGIPERNGIFKTISPTGGDDTNEIQSAIDNCPSGKVVLLSPGTFIVNNFVLINKDITLRGSGIGSTILQKTNGAVLNTYEATDYQPILIIGPNRWPHPNDDSSTDLVSDGKKGDNSVIVADVSHLSVGQTVLLDELSGASWQTDRMGRGEIYASPDYRVVWKLHNPANEADDPLFPLEATPDHPETTGGDATTWCSRPDRPTNEIKEITSIVGNKITFNTPLHIDYRKSHKARLTSYYDSPTLYAGIENLTVTGGSDGDIRFEHASCSWVKDVEVTLWLGHGIGINGSFRCEVRDSYIHDGAWSSPGGGGYAIALEGASSDILIENNIILKANKVMVANSAGAGSVYGYNYCDDGFINYNSGWIECGLNASHFVGSHHVLFEGNYGFNWDSDFTHGNSVYHTVFRNHLRGVRKPFINPLDSTRVDDFSQHNSPQRCIGAMSYSCWMTFIGNILGEEGKMDGWKYIATHFEDTPAIWWLGWDDTEPYPYDSVTLNTSIRDGNWDWLQAKQSWHNSNPVPLQNSLYLKSKPSFFGTLKWPWTEPETGRVYTLPAKARFENFTVNNTLIRDVPANIILYPNPVKDLITIQLSLPNEGLRCLRIFDSNGREVITLVKKNMSAGNYTFTWDCSNSMGYKVSPGVYFCQFIDNGMISIKKIILEPK